MTESLSTYKVRDASSYDRVTDSFDRYTERYSTPVAERIVELGGVGPGHRVLDVGTGTGVVALTAAPYVGPTGQVVGIDLSEGMLAAVRAKAVKKGLADSTAFEKHDAEALGLPDSSFDRVLSLYALLHFPNPERALSEMVRVLKPGGRLVVAIGSRPPLLSRQGVAYIARRLPLLVNERLGTWLVAPSLIDQMVSEQLEPLPESELAELPHAHGLSSPLDQLLENAGLTRVKTEAVAHLGVVSTPEEFWELQTTFSTRARKLIAAASSEAVASLEAAFLDRCARVVERGGKLVYPYAAFIGTGLRRE